MKTIFAAVPIHRSWEMDAKRSFDDLVAWTNTYSNVARFEVCRDLTGISLISLARNLFAKFFLESKCDYLFFYDSDIVCYNPEAIDLLVRDNLAIVAGPYVYKGLPVKPAFRLWSCKICIDPENAKKYDLRGEQVILAKYVSSGFMLVKREVVVNLCEKNKYPFMPLVNAEGEYLSEDWAFCERAQQSGYDCYLDARVDLGHLGLYPFTMDNFYNFWIDTDLYKQIKGKELIV